MPYNRENLLAAILEKERTKAEPRRRYVLESEPVNVVNNIPPPTINVAAPAVNLSPVVNAPDMEPVGQALQTMATAVETFARENASRMAALERAFAEQGALLARLIAALENRLAPPEPPLAELLAKAAAPVAPTTATIEFSDGVTATVKLG